MKKKQVFVCGIIAVILTLTFTTLSLTGCSGGGGGGKSLNSTTELKEYLDKQPANSPDKPIKVAMKVNEMMIGNIREVLQNADKYVSLDLSGSPLTTIPTEAFIGCTPLAGITIPNSVTSIGRRAFSGTGLISVTIPDSVTSIDAAAFSYCPSLTSITIPNSITSIGQAAFCDCTSLTSVTIPNSVTEIGAYAFAMCTSLASITVSKRTRIGEDAFPSTAQITYSD